MSTSLVRRQCAPDELPTVLSENEVAAYLGIDLKQLRRAGYDGQGPKTLKIAGQRRIRREHLIAWLNERGW